MRSEKILINLIKRFVETVSEECNHNPEFAEKIDQVLADSIFGKNNTAKKKQKLPAAEAIPGLYDEWRARNETEFFLWLTEHQVPVLLATIRSYELDAKKQSAKWKDSEKLASFIVEKLRAKSTRGSSFIRTETGIPSENNPQDLTDEKDL